MFLKNENIKLTLALIIFNANVLFIKASHIAGGEITYKHIKDFQYEFHLKVFRDCNSCKFNGIGGGTNSQNCNDLPMLRIHGALGTNYSQQFFSNILAERVRTVDVTPTCLTAKSKCQINSNVNIGLELHELIGVFDFQNLMSQGYCNFDVSLDVSSRNNNINTSLTEQKFFNFSNINLCKGNNNSVDFKNNQYQILYLNQTNRISLGVINEENDSLSFKLVNALTNRTQSVNYDLNRNYLKPFSIYCPGNLIDCSPNTQNSPSEGFYIDEKTGDVQFTPVVLGQGGVIVVQCEEWKKDQNGEQYLAGIVRRDINLIVESMNNNLPNIENMQTELKVCKGESINIPILVTDMIFSGSQADSVNLELLSDNNFFELNYFYTNQAPFKQYSVSINNNAPSGNYHFTLVARDNNCPFNGFTSKTFFVKILEKTPFNYFKEVKNCGMFLARSNNQLNSQNTWTLTRLNGEVLKQTIGRNLTYQFENEGKYLLKVQTKENELYCQNVKTDTIEVGNLNKPIFDLPVSIKVCENNEFYINPNKLETYNNFEIWYKNRIIAFPFKEKLEKDELLKFTVIQNNGCQSNANILVNVNKKTDFETMNKTYCYVKDGKYNLNDLLNVDLSKLNSINFEIHNSNIVVNKINEKQSEFEVFNTNNDIETNVNIDIVDVNGCQYSTSAQIKIISPEKILPKIPVKVCNNFNEIILPFFENGYWKNKSNGEILENNILKNTFQNDYLLEYHFNNFCQEIKEYSIKVNDTTKIEIEIQNNQKYCQSQEKLDLAISPSGGYWEKGNIIDNKLELKNINGKHYLKYVYINQNECFSQIERIIEVIKPIVPEILNAPSFLCLNEILYLEVFKEIENNNSQYWSTNGKGNLEILENNMISYKPSFEDRNLDKLKFTYFYDNGESCGNITTTTEIYIKEVPTGETSLQNPNENQICAPKLIIFNSNYTDLVKQSWFVNDSLVNEFDYNFPLKYVFNSGTFTIKSKQSNEFCSSESDLINIEILPNPKAIIKTDPELFISKQYPRIYLRNNSKLQPNYISNWYLNGNFQGKENDLFVNVPTNDDTVKISLVIKDEQIGCKDSTTKILLIKNFNELYIPTVFSPDSKGPKANETFRVYGEPMKYFQMEIYNSFGQMVFASDRMEEEWDGKYMNEVCQQGVYIIYIKVINQLDKKLEFRSSLTLLR